MTSSIFDMAKSAAKTEEEIQKEADDKRLADEAKAAKEILEAKIKKSKRRGAYVKQGLGVAKMAVGATAMYYTGGTVGGSLVVSGGSEAVAAEQEK